MSDKMRWQYGDTNIVVAAVDAETVIEIGDLVWQDGDDAKPAAALECTGRIIYGHAEFANNFLGVAMQRSCGVAGPKPKRWIDVATTGVFEFDCMLDTFELGQLIGADENAAGNALLNQQVGKVLKSRCAIGRVAKRQERAVASVLVDIRSTVMTGGVYARDE